MADFGKKWIESSAINLDQFQLIEKKLVSQFTKQDIEYSKKVLLYLCDGSLQDAKEYCIKNGKPDAFNCLRMAEQELVKVNQVYSRMTGTRPR